MVKDKTTDTLKQDVIIKFKLSESFHSNLKNMFVFDALLSPYLNFGETK